MRMRPASTGWVLLFLLGWVGTPAVHADERATPAELHFAEGRRELQKAEVLLQELKDDVEALRSGGYQFDPTERYIDARTSFDLKEYDKSALYLTSLLEDDRFRTDRHYYDAVQLLAVSLYKEGNFKASAHQFYRLVEAGAHSESSLVFLVEIATHLGRMDELDSLISKISQQPPTDALLYAKGKALYFLGRFDDAVTELSRLQNRTTDWFKAQYLTGASLVALKRLDDARAVYEVLVKQPVDEKDKGQAELVELAYLALGRIAYETNDFSKSADYYQRIPRNSPHFDRALFEVTHVHLRWAATKKEPAERLATYAKAEEILDILVNITQDPQLARDARVLRGRISMLLQKYEEAKVAYQEVVDLFAATSQELTDLAQQPGGIDKFFKVLLTGGDSDKQLQLFVSAEVVNWLKRQPALGTVVQLLDDVARQRAELEEAKQVYRDLEDSLNQETAREVFPGFSDAWTKSREIENRLLVADNALLRYEQNLVESLLEGADQTRLTQLSSERERLGVKLDSAPRTQGEYKARSKGVVLRLRRMGRDLDEQILRLERIEQQLIAMKRILREVKYKGSSLIEVKDEKALTTDIDKEAKEIRGLRERAQELRAQVEKEMLVAEVGDPMSSSEADVKSQLWRQHSTEAAFYIDLGPKVGDEVVQRIDEVNRLRRGVLAQLRTLREYQSRIDKKAALEIAHYKKILRAEKIELEKRERELAQTERRAMAFAREVGSALFVAAKEGLVRAVLEADLGIIDLAWKRAQDEKNQVMALHREKARVTGELRRELRALEANSQGE